jgi:hypothetical protein
MMNKYEAHVIGPAGTVVDVRRFECATDREAIERARQFVPALGVELRCEGRLVCRAFVSSSDARNSTEPQRIIIDPMEGTLSGDSPAEPTSKQGGA